MPKWVDRDDLEPVGGGPRNSVQILIVELREQPGRWAEVGRYPLTRLASARSRGATAKKRYPELQYAVREEDGEIILYMRVPPGDAA